MILLDNERDKKTRYSKKQHLSMRSAKKIKIAGADERQAAKEKKENLPFLHEKNAVHLS
jgi:hypothetical protein